MKASGVRAVDGRGGLDESGVPHAERFSTAADDDDLRREGEAPLFGGGAGATRVFLLPGLRPNDFGGGVETSSMNGRLAELDGPSAEENNFTVELFTSCANASWGRGQDFEFDGPRTIG